jgi:hypothetical protein
MLTLIATLSELECHYFTGHDGRGTRSELQVFVAIRFTRHAFDHSRSVQSTHSIANNRKKQYNKIPKQRKHLHVEEKRMMQVLNCVVCLQALSPVSMCIVTNQTL